MNIPLDNLHHWVKSLLPDDSSVYLFAPHGSKNISNLTIYGSKVANPCLPAVVIHDQEPLNYKLHSDLSDKYGNWMVDENNQLLPEYATPTTEEYRYVITGATVVKKLFPKINLQFIPLISGSLYYDNSVLIHSEQNSEDLIQYQQDGWLTVHYWSHAVIARDWYRFAKIDQRLNQVQPKTHKFLVYCRDWSDGREYRLKFLELLTQNNLLENCKVNVMHTNSSGCNYKNHQFINQDFEIADREVITSVSENHISSAASADYVPEDFAVTDVSVVLETVFDGQRIHLTEKTLRPIACGQPFILAAGPGALQYLRRYGFQTFEPLIDESYDLENNSLVRLKKIVSSMEKIKSMSDKDLEQLYKIARYNQQHFFSNEFFEIVKTELVNNLKVAFDQLTSSVGVKYTAINQELREQNLQHPEMYQELIDLLHGAGGPWLEL
jgi:hypothetical protein